MSASPVIIDDGGSTRIKQMSVPAGGKSMDRLMGHTHVDQADGKFPAAGAAARCDVTVVSINEDGVVTQVASIPLGAGQDAVIKSQGQKVTASLAGSRDLTLTVEPDPPTPGVHPIVEARQHADQRRYIVSNSGRIQEVWVDGVQVFAPPADTVYTLVRLG